MITVIGPYPTKENEKDGMVRRVQKIDACFVGKKRQYLSVSFRGPLYKKEKINNEVTVFWINFFLFWWYIIYLCINSSIIYVHSIYNSLFIFPVYFFSENIITDMHGVVVEEIKINKNHNRILILGGIFVYKLIELLVVKRSMNIICVTNNMKKYFCEIYGIESDKIKILPIFSERKLIEKYNLGTPLRAIYSGGIQPWQCIDETIEFIKNTSQFFRWTILSPNIKFFNNRLKDVEFKYGIEIKCVSPEEIEEYYKDSDLGLILRDDSIINSVACPTKLIDYLNYSILPIVKCPKIGDFYELKYSFFYYYDAKNIINQHSKEELKKMSTNNKKILIYLMDQANDSIEWLKRVNN